MSILFTSGDSLTRTTNLGSSETMTVCAWVRSRGTADWQGVFFMDAGAQDKMLGRVGSTTQFGIYDTNTGSTQIGSVSTNTWYFLAGVWDAANSTDGYFAAEGAASFTTAGGAGVVQAGTEATMYIGNDSAAEYWDGDVFNVKVWDEALTSDELWAERFSLAPKHTSNLLAWFPLTDNNDLRDLSGNGNLTETGTVTDGVANPRVWASYPQQIIVAPSVAAAPNTSELVKGTMNLTGIAPTVESTVINITSVDGDDTVLDGQQNVTVSGVGFVP